MVILDEMKQNEIIGIAYDIIGDSRDFEKKLNEHTNYLFRDNLKEDIESENSFSINTVDMDKIKYNIHFSLENEDEFVEHFTHAYHRLDLEESNNLENEVEQFLLNHTQFLNVEREILETAFEYYDHNPETSYHHTLNRLQDVLEDTDKEAMIKALDSRFLSKKSYAFKNVGLDMSDGNPNIVSGVQIIKEKSLDSFLESYMSVIKNTHTLTEYIESNEFFENLIDYNFFDYNVTLADLDYSSSQLNIDNNLRIPEILKQIPTYALHNMIDALVESRTKQLIVRETLTYTGDDYNVDFDDFDNFISEVANAFSIQLKTEPSDFSGFYDIIYEYFIHTSTVTYEGIRDYMKTHEFISKLLDNNLIMLDYETSNQSNIYTFTCVPTDNIDSMVEEYYENKKRFGK